MAVAHGAATGEHAWGRGGLFWGEEVVVYPRILERVAVVVWVAVSVDGQHVGGLVAA